MRKQYSKIKFNYVICQHNQYGFVVKDLGLACNSSLRLAENVYYSLTDQMPFKSSNLSEVDFKEVGEEVSKNLLKEFFQQVSEDKIYSIKLLVEQSEREEKALMSKIEKS